MKVVYLILFALEVSLFVDSASLSCSSLVSLFILCLFHIVIYFLTCGTVIKGIRSLFQLFWYWYAFNNLKLGSKLGRS